MADPADNTVIKHGRSCMPLAAGPGEIREAPVTEFEYATR